MPHLAHIALVVRDYDEALAFYVGRLGFELVEDTYQPEQDKRWVTIRPPGAGAKATTILLARASTPHQCEYIGDQAGGRVFLFLATDDFARDYAAFTAAGVEWVRPPVVQPYGTVAVFADIYGNLWDLIEPMPDTDLPALGATLLPPEPAPHPFAAPQVSRAAIRLGDKVAIEAETRMTPLGLLAVGGMVGAILLSVATISRGRRR